MLGGWTFGMKFYFYAGFPFSASDSKITAQINSGGGIGSILPEVIDPNIKRDLHRGCRQQPISRAALPASSRLITQLRV